MLWRPLGQSRITLAVEEARDSSTRVYPPWVEPSICLARISFARICFVHISIVHVCLTRISGMHICFVRILCRVDESDVTVRVRSVRIDERQANIAEFRQRRAPIARIYFSTGAIQP
jgi:hypothetical protein